MLCAGRVTNDIETIESSTNGIIFSDISDHLPIVRFMCEVSKLIK
jgi:hypothetical protein